LEIVNLVVPTLNDSEKMIRDLIHWILDEVGPNVPVHFTRFHPAFQMLNLPPTPVATLERAWQMARAAGIRYAYVGNVPGHQGNHTWCPQCHRIVIHRKGFFLEEMNVKQGKCTFCSQSIAGVWV
jgi:pyruvate formate lyase activating enzyme